MEPKRKSNGADGGDLRASKRLKVAEEKSTETPESTTKTGLEFLEQIRKTGDKNGRKIATNFEKLLPRKGNEDYYKRIRMPISLGEIEKRLHNGEFANLSELESYVKRMVQNAKDYYPRSSQQFDDAERIRKATSNFMVKHNPAYKLNRDYTAVPTPIPDELFESDADKDAADEAEADAEADGEAEEDDEADADGDGEEDEQGQGEDGEDEDAQDEEDAENEDDDEDDEPTSSRRQSSARGVRDTPLRGRRKSSERAVSVSAKPDHEYEGVPYKGLTFQQAQEKIMEEIIRRPDEEEEGYAYFEPFFNLPSRTLKDYFQVIKDPLSVKKLQKLVKGIRSRTDRSGVTEFKSWAAFEEKASLLWENAYFYNEDGSPIANMAKELEKMFRDELKKAKEVVAEPPQPKIKIKMPLGGRETPSSSKKITIHVANTRDSSADSPAPKTAGSASSDAAANSIAARNGSLAQATNINVEKTRSVSVASPSPSVAAAVATKHESSSRASPALSQRPNGVAPAAGAAGTPLPNGSAAAATPVNGTAPASDATTNSQPTAPPVPAPPPRPAYESKFREPGREPLITNLSMRTHPAINCGDRRFDIKLPPHPKLTQRSVTLNIPQGQWRQHLVISLAPAIQQQQRPFKLFVIANGATLGQSAPLQPPPNNNGNGNGTPSAADWDERDGKVYDVNLHPGVNVLQVQLIVGLAKDQKLPNGAEAELEKITIFANMMRY